jgi:hypothetical protein
MRQEEGDFASDLKVRLKILTDGSNFPRALRPGSCDSKAILNTWDDPEDCGHTRSQDRGMTRFQGSYTRDR